MKAPYVTNSGYFKRYVNTVSDAMAHIKTVCDNIYRRQGGSQTHPCYEIPYMLLQQRVLCNDEAKLCFFNMKFSHFVSGKNLKHSFKGYTKEDLIMFAYHCLQSIKHLENQYVLDGLVRVDLFKDDQGLLVVNELESLEASISSLVEKNRCQSSEFLTDYWYCKICESIACIGSAL